MAEKFDVSARLAEGNPAIDTLQHYVLACHQIGYQHPDLTLHAAQLRDWYGSEDGMNLSALQRDWLALDDVSRAVQNALAIQDRQLSNFSAAWQGLGAEESRDFLRRHGEASAVAAATVRTATEALGALRESLWRTVDAKVDAVVAIEGRAQTQRADWLAASAAVTTGSGDRAAAAEMVDQAVKPFVDSSIGSDWLAAMRTAATSAADAYRRAAAELAAEHPPVFEVPGALGPTWSPPTTRTHEETALDGRLPAVSLAGPSAPATNFPAGWSEVGAAAQPMTAQPAAAGSPAPPEVPAGPAVPSLGGMGSRSADFGGGLSGLGQKFSDMLSGLLSGTGGAVPQVPDLDVPELGHPVDLEDGATGDEADDGATGDEEDRDLTGDAPDDEADEEEPGDDGAEADDAALDGDYVAEEPAENPVATGAREPRAEDGSAEVSATPAPIPAPPPAEPLPPADLPTADPVVAEQTPCAIAADELPQVGDPSE